MKETTTTRQKRIQQKRDTGEKYGRSRCEILGKVAISSLTFSFPAILSMHSNNFNMKHREAIDVVHQFFIKLD